MARYTIYKYGLALTDSQLVLAPYDFEPLSVGMQFGSACLWARVDEESPRMHHEVRMVGTGQLDECLTSPGFQFVGTFLSHGDRLVMHVYVACAAPKK